VKRGGIKALRERLARFLAKLRRKPVKIAVPRSIVAKQEL
jgi:hypothetical protein